MIFYPYMNQRMITASKLVSKLADNDIRRQLSRQAIDFYTYNQEPYMQAYIETRYPDTYGDLMNYIVTIDLTRSLVNQLAKIFQNDPVIKIDTTSQVITDAVSDLLDSVNLFGMLRIIDRYAENCNQVGIVPIYNERTGKIRLDFITPDRCIVWQDEKDPALAVKVAYTIKAMQDTPIANEIIYAIWTDDLYQEASLKTDGSIDKEYLSIPNPYKRIPIVWFSTETPIDNFWVDRQYPMMAANIRSNFQLTNLDVALDFQSFSTFFTTGMPDSTKLIVGMQRYINIPLDPETGKAMGSVGYANPSPQLDTVWKIINENIALSAAMMGISAEAIRQNSNVTSGYQLRLSKSDVIDRNQDKRSAYRESVRELVQAIMDCKTLNSKIKLPDDANIKIDFADVKVESDPMQDEQIRSMKISNGTMSRVDALMQDNDDLTREEAIAEIKRIDSDNNTFRIGQPNLDQGLFE